VYNLVNTSTHSTLSAGILDSQMSVFLDILNQWKAWEAQLPALVHPLSYQYTANGLISARLKGNDFHLAKRVMQGCARDGQICVLLANMEVQLTDSNGEDDSSSQTDEKIFLEHVVDTEGSALSVGSLRIAGTILTRPVIDDNRAPDVQQGGNYLGNQYAEIDQFYRNSVGSTIKMPITTALSMHL